MAQDENLDKTQLDTAHGTNDIIVGGKLSPRLMLPKMTLSHVRALRHQRIEQRWLAIAALPLAIVTVLAVLAYRGNFTLGHVVAGTTSVNLSAPDSALVSAITKQSATYGFTLAAPGQPATTYTLKDAGISISPTRSVADTHAAVRNLGWDRFAWWKTAQVPLAINRDQTAFNAFIKTHVAIANQAAKDASVSATTGAPVISDGAAGWTYAVPGGNLTIADAARTLRPLKVTLAKTTVSPALQRDNLTAAETKIKAYLDHTVTFNLGDTAYTATRKDIGSWLDVEPAPAHKTVDVSVNSGKVQAYLDKVTKADVHPPRSEITTTDAEGVKTVLIAGQNGVDITNKADVVKAVTAQLQQATPAIHADLAASYKNFSTINAADYPKWIVADVTTKRMYAYEHATLVRSFLVSAGAPKTPTVIGTYQIYKKFASKDMRGNNADGSRYFQPHVHYVNYFYQDYAIHGNYWRPNSYFGNINSSHGCVGITDSDAQWLYDWAPIGTTVITHA